MEGDSYLPGENTEKRDGAIVALRYGLAEESENIVKVIPLSGVYSARRGNVIIGRVTDTTMNGWIVDIGCAQDGFIPLMEYPRFVNKHEIEEVMSIGDMVVVKIMNITKRGIDLTMRQRGLMKIFEGIIMKVNPQKVPRIIGKEGSMVILIKDKTGCNVTVGQNGYIWIHGESIEKELIARKVIMFIAEKAHQSGLTEEVEKWFAEELK